MSRVRTSAVGLLLLGGVGLGSIGLGGLVMGVGCNGGTTLFNAPDPKQCASGNGCPMVVCVCKDKSLMIDSTCELGACKDEGDICDDRCIKFGGTESFNGTPNDEVAMPGCDILDERMLINKCGEGVDLLMSDCISKHIDCSTVSNAFWQCVEARAVLSCSRGALHVVGCEDFPFAPCTQSGGSSTTTSTSSGSVGGVGGSP